MSYTTPIFLAGIRTFISGIILLAYSFKTNNHKGFNRKDFGVILQVAILSIFLYSIFKNLALNGMTSIKTGFFQNLDPFIAALYAYALFSEKLTSKKWLGMLVAFSGALVYLFSSSPLEKEIGEIAFISIPELCIIFSIAVNRLGWFKIQYLVKDKKYSPPFIIGSAMLLGGVMSLIASFILEPGPKVTNMSKFLGYLSYIVISSNLIGYNLYAYLHRAYSAVLITLVGFSQPLFVAFYGVVFLKESISVYYIASTILVFIGVAIFYRNELKTNN